MGSSSTTSVRAPRGEIDGQTADASMSIHAATQKGIARKRLRGDATAAGFFPGTPRIEKQHVPAVPGQARSTQRPCRASADDADVHGLKLREEDTEEPTRCQCSEKPRSGNAAGLSMDPGRQTPAEKTG